MSETILQFLDTFNTFTKKPQRFLSTQSNITDDIKGLVKNIYDFTKTSECKETKGNALPELIVENFDDEQIWQELELQNEDCNNSFISDVSQLIARKDRLTFPFRLKGDEDISESEESKQQKLGSSDNEEPDEMGSDNEEPDEMGSENDSDLDDELKLNDEENEEDNDSVGSDFEKISIKKKPDKRKPSIVDDKFFKLSDMEHFLESEGKKYEKLDQSSELFNFFEDSPSKGMEASSVENDMYYNDFFDAIEDGNPDEERYEEYDMEDDELGQDDIKEDGLEQNNMEDYEFDQEEDEKNNEEFIKQVRFNLNDDDDSDKDDDEMKTIDIVKKVKGANEKDNDTKVKSTLELRQERLGKLINKLEEEAISEKPWQLKGEITAGARPQNSLLEEVVDFDITARPAPVMTEETTLRLEDIIVRRIKDKSWDDVERKVKPVETPAEFKKKLVLDQEKSKLSLAEVYEQEFIKQRDATKQQGDDTEEQEVEPPLHNEVRSMLTSLFNKLDALSNYHYTPRPAEPELKIITNERAITMEEVAPVATTDATLLAPEEIQAKRRGDLIGKDERSATDKKRARRIKKKRQREQQKSKEQLQKTVNRLNPGLGNKYSKQKAVQDLKKVLNERNVSKMEEKNNKAVRSSTTFFRNLQDEVSSTIRSKTQPLKKKKDTSQLNAKKLKL